MPIYFFDESRFGTHSRIGHGWFKRGQRTEVKVKLGFKNFYLYSAVNIESGEDITLLMPNVDTECMNVWLEQFNKCIGGKEVMLVMDGAGWHKSKGLKVPSNIKVIFLPPYSPELNPVERLWKFIKDNTIKNRIFDDVESLADHISNFIRTLDNATTLSVCKVNYL